MWSAETQGCCDQRKPRHPSDLIDEEWGLVEGRIPPAKRGGNKRRVDAREVVGGLIYVPGTGCRWRRRYQPARRTVNHSFRRWRHDGTLDRPHHVLLTHCLTPADREASP